MFIMFVGRMVVIFSLLWGSSQACNPNDTCFINVDDPNIQNLIASMDHFTTQLIQRLYNPNSQSMIPGVISPYSNWVVLGLVIFGSAGNTQKELMKALNFPDGDMQPVKKSFGDILIATEVKRSGMVDGKEDIALEGHVAEGLFIQKNFTPAPDFADYLAALNIKTQPVDFSSQDAQNAVFSWIDANTPLPGATAKSFASNGNTKIYINSMFYLHAKWSDNFFLDIKPSSAPFTTINNQPIQVDMMRGKTTAFYYDNKSSYSAVELFYEWYDFTALIILPHKGVDAAKFVNTFQMDILKEFDKNAAYVGVDVQIPRFSFSYAYGMNPVLQDLGVQELFGEADLREMIDAQKQNLGVQVAHNVDIVVNEKGTMADGLNVAPVPKNPPPNLTPFIADHPFLMLIRSTHSSAIAFATFYHGGANSVVITSSSGSPGSSGAVIIGSGK